MSDPILDNLESVNPTTAHPNMQTNVVTGVFDVPDPVAVEAASPVVEEESAIEVPSLDAFSIASKKPHNAPTYASFEEEVASDFGQFMICGKPDEKKLFACQVDSKCPVNMASCKPLEHTCVVNL